jgi:hypothetical protein
MAVGNQQPLQEALQAPGVIMAVVVPVVMVVPVPMVMAVAVPMLVVVAVPMLVVVAVGRLHVGVVSIRTLAGILHAAPFPGLLW